MKKKILLISLVLLCIGLFIVFIYPKIIIYKPVTITEKQAIKQLIKNYGKPVKILSKKFNIPESYLLALIMLESSGKKKVPARYEKNVYKKLLHLKQGKIKKFENITTKDLKKTSRRTLKKMACSYGPFQIMGYKSFFLKIPFKKLTGKYNMYYAVKWIKLTYGQSLKEKNYKDAFHIHNTGKKYPKIGLPKTHNPKYVQEGLRFEKIFRKKL